LYLDEEEYLSDFTERVPLLQTKLSRGVFIRSWW